jgi:hypothetical protein
MAQAKLASLPFSIFNANSAFNANFALVQWLSVSL